MMVVTKGVTVLASRVRPTAALPASAAAVLDACWDAPAATAHLVMEATGLTRSTALDALTRLAETGLVTEIENARATSGYHKGRPSRRWRLNASAGYVIGIDAGMTHIRAQLADLGGAILGDLTRHLEPPATTSERISHLGKAIEDLQARAGLAGTRAWVICVGVPAPVDRVGVSPTGINEFWDLMNPGLTRALAHYAPIIAVDNDAVLAAHAEGTVGAAREAASYVSLLASDRLGCGVVIDGTLVRGSLGGVGELHVLTHVAEIMGTDGIRPRLLERARTYARRAASGSTPEQILADDVHPWARRARTAVAREIAHVLAMCTLYGPELIIVGGAVAPHAAHLVDEASDLLPSLIHAPTPRVVTSRLGGDIVVTGALASALAQARRRALELATLPQPSRSEHGAPGDPQSPSPTPQRG